MKRVGDQSGCGRGRWILVILALAVLGVWTSGVQAEQGGSEPSDPAVLFSFLSNRFPSMELVSKAAEVLNDEGIKVQIRQAGEEWEKADGSRWRGEAIQHEDHWVIVKVFKHLGGIWQIQEIWSDEGYAEHWLFPVRPVYTGTWVQLRWCPPLNRWAKEGPKPCASVDPRMVQ